MATCTHGVTQEAMEKRYDVLVTRISATPEDDHEAQWSEVFACACCLGPARWYDQDKEPRCSHCPI